MQFQVPQFIDIEDKVIGPLTIKQFLYLLVAGVVIFILYKILNLFATIVLAIPIIGVAITLAFVRVHGQPFMSIVSNFLKFLKKPDFYVWKKPISKNPTQEQADHIEIIKREPAKTKIKPEARLSGGQAKENLQDVGWKVEIEK